jgi:hypothetical protein
MPADCIISYLWNSTVRVEISRMAAISFAVLPSARSCRISLCRGVREATGSFDDSGSLRVDSRIKESAWVAPSRERVYSRASKKVLSTTLLLLSRSFPSGRYAQPVD